VISGIIKKEDPNGLTIQAANELVIVPHTEIEAREQTASSMMPDGLIAKLSPQEVRNLIAYLASPSQVALPPEAAGAESKDAEPAAGGQ
jgi:putative heme-binding domain-containing protein